MIMSLDLIKDTFCIYGEFFHTGRFEGYSLNNGIVSSTQLRSFLGKYIVITGLFYNIDVLKKSFQIEYNTLEEIILQLYDKLGIGIASFLEGTYSIVIVDGTTIIAFRDKFSIENLYYHKNKKSGSFIFSNSLFYMKNFLKFEVNTDILPKYFLHSQINGRNTFVKDVFTIKTFEVLTYDLSAREWQSSISENLPYKAITTSNADDKLIID